MWSAPLAVSLLVLQTQSAWPFEPFSDFYCSSSHRVSLIFSLPAMFLALSMLPCLLNERMFCSEASFYHISKVQKDPKVLRALFQVPRSWSLLPVDHLVAPLWKLGFFLSICFSPVSDKDGTWRVVLWSGAWSYLEALKAYSILDIGTSAKIKFLCIDVNCIYGMQCLWQPCAGCRFSGAESFVT